MAAMGNSAAERASPEEQMGDAVAGAEALEAVPPGETPATPPARGENLALILDVPVHVTAELGRTMLPVSAVLGLSRGSVVEFERQPGEPVDILVNGQPIARGDVVIVNDRFGVRITALMQNGGVGEGSAEET